MSRFYVYTLSYPQEMGGQVFYVGKGTKDRMYHHERETRAGYSFSAAAPAIRIIWAMGYQVVREIAFETDDELEAYRKEVEVFEQHQSPALLCRIRPAVPHQQPKPRGSRNVGPRNVWPPK